VGIIQPNVAEQEKYQSSSTIILERLKNFAAISDKDSLVVFPEAVWPIAGKQSEISVYSDFSNQIYRDVVLGTAFIDEGGYYNAAVFSGREGEVLGVYKKMHLVPFGEYIPMRKMLSFISVINQLGDMNQGKEYKIFSWRDKRFAVLICFEDLYSNQAALLSRQSDFLVNITNDEWFRGEPEASQHLAILTFRAIENRISIVRCANTGVSGWVSFKGDIHRLQKNGKEDFVEGVWNEEIPINHKRSLFSKLGESFFVLICAFWLIFAVFKLR
jgi:apolipoprotein N-acyltransferase